MSPWTLQRDPTYYRRERQMVQVAAASYNRFDAHQRFEAEVAGDRIYRFAVLAAISLALLAGSGFGQLHLLDDLRPVILLSVATAGLACALTFVNAVLVAKDRAETSNALAQAALVGMVTGFILIPLWCNGRMSLTTAAIAATCFFIVWTSLGFTRMTRVPSYLALAIAFPCVFCVCSRSSNVWQIVASALAGGAAFTVLVIVARRAKCRVQPGGLLAQLALIVMLWTILQGRTLTQGAVSPVFVWHGPFVALVATGLAAAVYAWGRYDRFSAAAATVILVHLGGAACAPSVVFTHLEPHLAAAAGEFLLLVVAAVRIWKATCQGMPPGNFLRSPQCCLPLLEQAQGFALESDVLD